MFNQANNLTYHIEKHKGLGIHKLKTFAGRTVLGIDHCNHNSPAPLLIQYSTDVDPGAGIFMVDSRNYKVSLHLLCLWPLLRNVLNDKFI